MRYFPIGICWIIVTVLVAVPGRLFADFFYPIRSVSVTVPRGGGIHSTENLIQGPGFGYSDSPPHGKLLSGQLGDWVTDSCGVNCDYIAKWGKPVISLDLGKNLAISEISVWGYEDSSAAGVKDFSLRFATEMDGARGFGRSIAFNPTYADLMMAASARQGLLFNRTINARYVEMTILDNFHVPREVAGAEFLAGGDRVALGEIAFRSPTDPCLDPGSCPVPSSDDFYPIKRIQSSTSLTDLWPASNLIQGAGVGFGKTARLKKRATDELGNWVTESCGSPCDYYSQRDVPLLIIDLGDEQLLNEIDIWGYNATNANGVSQFELRFATEAEGPQNFGRTIFYNPTFSSLVNDDVNLQAFSFSQPVRARYIEFKPTDNLGGRPGEPDGGDRVGLGEIGFRKVTRLLGDFDADGVLDADDINSLVRDIVTGSNYPKFDLDNQGTVNANDMRIWVKTLKNTWFGDANLDGEFNSTDLVKVFESSAAKFEQPVEVGWSEGDWTGDQRFGTSDFVAAFQDGGYEIGPRAGLMVVPEPTSFTLLLIGLIVCLSREPGWAIRLGGFDSVRLHPRGSKKYK